MTKNPRNLILMRHGATEEKSYNGNDINRKLSTEGINQVTKVSKIIANLKIDKILVSPAIRTRETLDIILQEVSISNIEVKNEMYQADQFEMIDLIKEQPNNVNSLLIIGHNPYIQSLALNFAIPGTAYTDFILDHPIHPATLIMLQLSSLIDWQAIQPNSAVITSFYNF